MIPKLVLAWILQIAKKNEKQLKNQRNELQNIYNSMPVMINIHDSNTGIAEVNKYFENRLGYSSEDAAKTDLLHEILYDKNDYESIKKTYFKP